MSGSRWQSNLNDFFQWIGESDDDLIKLLMPSVFARGQKKDGESDSLAPDPKNEPPKISDILPILPLRGVVVYPNTAVPLTVGQPRSIKLVDDVVGGDKLVGLVAALDPEKEMPGPD